MLGALRRRRRTKAGSPLLLLLLLALGACAGDPPVYLQRIYIDAVQPGAEGLATMAVRFQDDEGTPVAPAALEALVPVAGGVPIGRFTRLRPLRDSGLTLALVVDPALPALLFEPMRASYLRLVDALGPRDRVWLVAGPAPTEAEEGPPLSPPLPLPPAEAHRQLLALQPPPPPAVSPGEAAGARRPAGGPVGWVQPPLEPLERAITLLGGQGAAAPRRALVTLVEGRVVGRSWNPVARWASASGVDLHLITVPPEGRTTQPGRIELPLIVYPADDVGSLPTLVDQVLEGVVGGWELTLQTERQGVALVQGLGIRCRLPRGGWEEFLPPPLAYAPAHLSLDQLEPLGAGRWRTVARASDGRGQPLPLHDGQVELLVDEQPLTRVPPPAAASSTVLLGVLVALPTSAAEGEAQRAALRRLVEQLGPGDRLALASAGTLPFGEHPPTSDRATWLAQIEQLGRTVATPVRDLESDANDLLRQLLAADRAGTARRAMLVISELRELRLVRGAGQGTPRFAGMLRQLRQQNVTPLWVAKVPRGEYEGLRTAVRRLAGGDLYTVASRAELAERVGQAVGAFGRPLVLAFQSALSEEQLRTELVGRFAYRGRAIESRPGVPLPTPVR